MNRTDIVKKLTSINEKWEKYAFSISETDDQINDVFFSGDSIYIGSSCGGIDYCEIGSIDNLCRIMYRVVDIYCDLVFDFGLYRTHIAIDGDENKISVYNCQNGEWVCWYSSLEESKKIETCIREITSEA